MGYIKYKIAIKTKKDILDLNFYNLCFFLPISGLMPFQIDNVRLI